ncbi:hypothetical protein LEP1GSC108_3315 [Leptospira weilii str. UI 13098]|uniref:Uncharacterized protein n=1 Tax=Leptospira weilii str. UI 13098 TaxID=1088542 RepID=M6Q6L7_9LEPT|nr:hypothetical protein LEP1GSC108_3315 [Leptospira weilii str. UI 13098]
MRIENGLFILFFLHNRVHYSGEIQILINVSMGSIEYGFFELFANLVN